MSILKTYLYFYEHRLQKNSRVMNELVNHNMDYLMKNYNNILDMKPLDNIREQYGTKSVRQHYQKYRSNSFLMDAPKDYNAFYQDIYKPYIQKLSKDILAKRHHLFACNSVGHSLFFLLFIYYPEWSHVFGKPSTIRLYEQNFRLFLYKIIGMPFHIQETPRYYLFTQQYFHTFFTPSSLSLQQAEQLRPHLSQQQLSTLRRRHVQCGMDKKDYTGSYGVYFQLVYKPLSWFGRYKTEYTKNSFGHQSRYVYDAEILLQKITQEMRQHGITRFSEFIYFNAGWNFGRILPETIRFTDTPDFFTKCRPHTDNRNEVVIRWIVPVDVSFGMLNIGECSAYASTYY